MSDHKAAAWDAAQPDPRKPAPVPKELSAYLSKIGAKGGSAGTGKAKARDPEKMRQAALKRWEKRGEKAKEAK